MMNGVVTVITFIDKLKYARQSELQVQAELEHIERLHRIMRLPNRSAVYAAELAEKLAALERRLNNSIDLAVDRKNEALNILDNLEGDERTVMYAETFSDCKRKPENLCATIFPTITIRRRDQNDIFGNIPQSGYPPFAH